MICFNFTWEKRKRKETFLRKPARYVTGHSCGVKNGQKCGMKLYIVVRNVVEIKEVTTADKILNFYRSLHPGWNLPDEIELLFPFDNGDTWYCVQSFYQKYFDDQRPRTLILGINPGRFGAGVTGIPFTDPKILYEECKIDNPFPKKNELSAIFIYELIERYGGKEQFYNEFFISSVCPLGFIKNGVNINYYDERSLTDAVEPYIIELLIDQIRLAGRSDKAYCLGKGRNYKYLKKLNDKHQFFGEVVPIPHPRWVMQYRRKQKDQIAESIIQLLKK